MDDNDRRAREAIWSAIDAEERQGHAAYLGSWNPPRPVWTAEDGERLQARLRALLAYYASTRGVGHTTVLLAGTQRTRHTDTLILALTQQHADVLTHESTLRRGQGLSWGELPWCLTSLRGRRAPLAVDHAVLQACLEDCLREMARLQGQVEALQTQYPQASPDAPPCA